MVAQQKVMVCREVFEELAAQGKQNEIDEIKQRFINLNERMWERGVFDRDCCWEDNYGISPEGELVLIDFGDLSDKRREFPYYEGLRRYPGLYELGLRETFRNANFRRFFRKNLDARAYSAGTVFK